MSVAKPTLTPVTHPLAQHTSSSALAHLPSLRNWSSSSILILLLLPIQYPNPSFLSSPSLSVPLLVDSQKSFSRHRQHYHRQKRKQKRPLTIAILPNQLVLSLALSFPPSTPPNPPTTNRFTTEVSSPADRHLVQDYPCFRTGQLSTLKTVLIKHRRFPQPASGFKLPRCVHHQRT